MRLEKHIVALLAFLLPLLSAKADVLLWQVRDNPATASALISVSDPEINWSYAVLRATR